MKTAFATLDGRIAPVFDVVGQIQVVVTEGNRIVEETLERIVEGDPMGKAIHLTELGVDAMVCGAISRSLQTLISARGILVVAFVAGDLALIRQAWIEGDHCLDRFTMPGCRHRGRRAFSRTRNLNQDDPSATRDAMGFRGSFGGQGRAPLAPGPRGAGQSRGKGRSGSGSGQGGSEPGPGAKGGSRTKGASGYCLCSNCGYQAPHLRGTPCVELRCPQCGHPMARM